MWNGGIKIKFENKEILEKVVSKIIGKDYILFDGSLENEISKELLPYLNRKSCIRKIISFTMHEKMSEGPSYLNINKIDEISDVSMNEESEIKIKENLKKELVKTLNKVISEQNKYIIDNLVEYAKEKDLITTIEKNNYEEMRDFVTDISSTNFIADNEFKPFINSIDSNEYDIVDSEDICFLKEAENYIIKLNFDEGLFEVLEDSKLISLNLVESYKFIIRLYDMVSIKPFSADFISVIKLNEPPKDSKRRFSVENMKKFLKIW